MGGSNGNRLITAEEGAVMVDELEATAPMIEQQYPDADAVAIRSALTDADLFLSYNMPAKAVVPLLAVLPRAPYDARLNQRLAALHTRAERFAEAASCCRVLENAYSASGYPDEAIRYGELAVRYEERAATSSLAHQEEDVKAFAASWPVQSPASTDFAPKIEVPEEEFSTQPEISATEDLSAEWEDDLTVEASPSPAIEAVASAESEVNADSADLTHEISEGIEETRFYVEHSMLDQARAALAKLEALTSDSTILDALRQELDSAAARSIANQEIEVDSAEAFATEPEEVAADPDPAVPASEDAIGSFVADLESSLGDGFLPGAPETTAPIVHAADASDHGHGRASDLGSMVNDLEAALGDGFMEEAPELSVAPEKIAKPRGWPAPKAPSAPPKLPVVAATQFGMAAAASVSPVVTASAAAAAAPALAPAAAASGLSYRPSKVRPLAVDPAPVHAAGVDLSEMFGELKQELEEDVTAADEDPETHYNLGVAFREMGLLDEAIGELQKVCQAVERGQTVPHLMQTYTWLAQCFLDKGVPEAAIRWYETALKLPNLDQDTRTALHYELASAFESAENKPGALQHFMEVYGSNIDYRDVAERIKALKS
jgi:tetratricopeptide (TPR) repeat protein